MLAIWLLNRVFDQTAQTSQTSNAVLAKRAEESAKQPGATYSPTIRKALAVQTTPPSNSPSTGDAKIKEWVDRAANRGDEWGRQSDVTELPTVRRALPVEPVEPAVPSTTPLEATYRVVNDVPGGVLNLREGPGFLSRLLVKIRAGTGGIRIGEGRNNGPTLWRKIRVGPYSGWVNQEYLEAENTH